MSMLSKKEAVLMEDLFEEEVASALSINS